MKPSAVALALFATVSAFAAEPAPATAPAPTAPATATPTLTATELNQQLAATLADIREQSVARAPENQTEAAADPEVLELPKLTVKQQPRPRQRLGESTILGPKAFNDDLAKKNLSALDRSVLNKFTLPSWLGGVSAADRAREEFNIQQKRQFMDDVLTISKAAEQTDPAAAKALREAAAKP